jgi:lariat debranching enzyme
MRDLYFGGWIAPRIYYLGQAGSIFLEKGNQRVRVTGISGIYNHNDFKYGLKTEVIPLTGNSIISSYHVKQLQIFRL